MAVKPEIIKARLKVLFPKANLSQKRLDVYTAKLAPKPTDDADEATIDALINDYNDVIDFEAVAKEDDRIRTLESDRKKAEDAEKNKGGNNDSHEEEDETEGMTKFEKMMLKKFVDLSSDLEAVKTGNITQIKKQSALQSFENSEILKALKPELKDRWVSRVDINSETSIEDQIKELESEYSDLVQTGADTNVYAGPAGGGSSDQKPDELAVNEIVDNLNI